MVHKMVTKRWDFLLAFNLLRINYLNGIPKADSDSGSRPPGIFGRINDRFGGIGSTTSGRGIGLSSGSDRGFSSAAANAIGNVTDVLANAAVIGRWGQLNYFLINDKK